MNNIIDYKEFNDQERSYYKKDFSKLDDFVKTVRKCLSTGEPFKFKLSECADILDYKGGDFIYITLFQEMQKPLRFGSNRKNLEESINVCIYSIRKNERFKDFEVENPDKTRILFEWITHKEKIDIEKLHPETDFDRNRMEPGIIGVSAKINNTWLNWLPSDSPVKNSMDVKTIIDWFLKQTGNQSEISKPMSQKKKILKNIKNSEYYVTKSHEFITYQNKIIPLYRGNILYDEFSYDTVKNIIINGNDYACRHMAPNGQFMYYYNPTLDNNVDHEHPGRKAPNLYYNDLRHSGVTISLLYAYKITKDKKYLEAAKKSIDWSTSICEFYKDENGEDLCFPYYNTKGKLGGAGVLLVAILRYKIITQDNQYDKYIEALTRHLISRLTPEGEFLGYYIHPSYNEGKPLLSLSDEDRKNLFSFYYPGEALLGLALYLNYEKNPQLRELVAEKSKLAMKWIIEERPKKYAELFTKLPSDAWLMQAIEEFSYCKENILEQNAIDFVFNDAQTMMDLTYQSNDSPYIDFEGGMYKEYGNHYYPDSARGEGLIAAYYLAKHLNKNDLADKILAACKKAAKCQFQLAINEYNNYAHLNPSKSFGGIKFKVTRQWLRIDAVQHTCSFFAKLYLSENTI